MSLAPTQFPRLLAGMPASGPLGLHAHRSLHGPLPLQGRQRSRTEHPLILELERAGIISRTEIARRLGWVRNPPRSVRARGCLAPIPDTGRVTRILGLKASRPQKTVAYELGVRLCEMLQLDPVDCGV